MDHLCTQVKNSHCWKVPESCLAIHASFQIWSKPTFPGKWKKNCTYFYLKGKFDCCFQIKPASWSYTVLATQPPRFKSFPVDFSTSDIHFGGKMSAGPSEWRFPDVHRICPGELSDYMYQKFKTQYPTSNSNFSYINDKVFRISS